MDDVWGPSGRLHGRSYCQGGPSPAVRRPGVGARAKEGVDARDTPNEDRGNKGRVLGLAIETSTDSNEGVDRFMLPVPDRDLKQGLVTRHPLIHKA